MDEQMTAKRLKEFKQIVERGTVLQEEIEGIRYLLRQKKLIITGEDRKKEVLIESKCLDKVKGKLKSYLTDIENEFRHLTNGMHKHLPEK